MTTFVLVHGAWSGAHGLRLVRRGLQTAGHEAFTPSLTGIGERVHLTGPQVDLRTHVDDVVNHVLFEDHDDFVLLGFSYGGAVVTAALVHIAERVRHLVYLDAVVPSDGQTPAELFGMATPLRTVDAPWSVPPIPRALDDPDLTEWANARRVPQPIATITQPVHLSKPLEEFDFERTFIKATAEGRDGADPFWPFADRYRDHPAWNYHEIATTHMIPENRPDDLIAILLTLA